METTKGFTGAKPDTNTPPSRVINIPAKIYNGAVLGPFGGCRIL